jgi:hypothetical protein
VTAVAEQWVMRCSADDGFESTPFEIDAESPEFEAASLRMAQHVIGAHDGAGSVQILMFRVADAAAPATEPGR